MREGARKKIWLPTVTNGYRGLPNGYRGLPNGYRGLPNGYRGLPNATALVTVSRR